MAAALVWCRRFWSAFLFLSAYAAYAYAIPDMTKYRFSTPPTLPTPTLFPSRISGIEFAGNYTVWFISFQQTATPAAVSKYYGRQLPIQQPSQKGVGNTCEHMSCHSAPSNCWIVVLPSGSSVYTIKSSRLLLLICCPSHFHRSLC